MKGICQFDPASCHFVLNVELSISAVRFSVNDLCLNDSYSGSSAPTKQPNHHTVPIIAGVVGGFVAMVTILSLFVCFMKHRRRPIPPSLERTSERHAYDFGTRFAVILNHFSANLIDTYMLIFDC